MSLWRTIRWSGGAVPNWDARRFWQAPQTLDAADPQIPNLPLLAVVAGGGITGSGILVAQAVTATGIGKSTSLSTDGAIFAQVATVVGTGKSISRSTDGAIFAQVAIVAGIGKSTSLRTGGTLVAQSATIVGVGIVGDPPSVSQQRMCIGLSLRRGVGNPH